jgi:hypothetical protein
MHPIGTQVDIEGNKNIIVLCISGRHRIRKHLEVIKLHQPEVSLGSTEWFDLD